MRNIGAERAAETAIERTTVEKKSILRKRFIGITS
jgi:hypothetical protein